MAYKEYQFARAYPARVAPTDEATRRELIHNILSDAPRPGRPGT